MGEQLLAPGASDRSVEQAIVALKKGAHLLKYSRMGKPKFCPFRLSQKQLQPERESQCISLVYANGEQYFDLICKDKMQAESWFLGLRAVISRSRQNRLLGTGKHRRGAQSCINSPASYIRRRQILGLPEEMARSNQVRSLARSPDQSFSGRGYSDGLSCSSDSIFSKISVSDMQSAPDGINPSSPYSEADDINQRAADFFQDEIQSDILAVYAASVNEPVQTGHVLRDVYVWGEGIGGFLGGGGEKLDSSLPKVLDSTVMLDVQTLSLGRNHASLVTKQGEVFCWGEGKKGRLGHKVDMDVSHPKLVETLSGVSVRSVACGEYQMYAVTPSGELYTWGDSSFSADWKRRSHWLPQRVSGSLDGVPVSSVACGEWHTAIISTSGELFTYGEGNFGALGHGNTKSLPHPKHVESLKDLWVKSVACGPWHTAAIVDIMVDRYKLNNPGGKLFTWGDGDKGKLGHSDQDKKLLPTCVTKLVGQDFIQVSCGRTLTVVLSIIGKVYTMGSAVYGQLGNPQAEDKPITVVQGKLKDEFAREICAGSYHVAVLTTNGNVYTWGRGVNGQLGLGDTKDRNSPTLVDGLRDRQVEHITCGPSSTAAICLHKSVSSTDQASCRGCSMAFGITRKKHNCYNCGLLFCRICCSKKSPNASLAPNKNKPFRVCDTCFSQLQRTAQVGRPPELEACTPRPFFITTKALVDKEEREQAQSTTARVTSRRKCSNMSDFSYDGKTLNNQVETKQCLDLTSSVESLPRWGQVPCPESFKRHLREHTEFQTSSARDQFTSISPVRLLQYPKEPKVIPCSASVQQDFSESDKLLLEEAQKLRAQVEGLKKLCHSRKEKIQERKQKIKEIWSLAIEQEANCEAAKEDIRVLTSRLQAMSEDVSAGTGTKDQSCESSPQITSPYTGNTDMNPEQSNLLATCPPIEVLQPEERKTDSLCSSPIVFSSTSRFLRKKDNHGHSRSTEESCPVEGDSGQAGSVASGLEWVEQFQPGVYITLKTLPGGRKNLKRVRFSRKRFTEKEAEKWWSENQMVVCQRYNIDITSDISQD
nr:PH, RCC1 and FYVE domains-containing protein 1 isoform X1 [Ipomoea batatas]GMC96861.1 PH, RCC1 and FYVE domains-containing protein 1 isoform X1 [Ipomoea batatas]GME14392.1 PH, RCC1 and FYVE domains-containing protein 1 isoform X1 [Ipomoea batatas]